MAMQMDGPKRLSAEMNVTPMIDILLVLIIIFLIIPPPVEKGEDAHIPQPDPHTRSKPIERPGTLIVQVLSAPGDQLPQVRINQESVPWAGLPSRLRDILKLRAEKVVFVMADKDIAFETVAQVIDMIHQAGADKVGLMTNRPGDWLPPLPGAQVTSVTGGPGLSLLR